MTTETEIVVNVFEAPAGKVRGFLNAHMLIKGKSMKRIAHAILLVGKAPTITIDVPAKLTVDQMDCVGSLLKEFSAKVRELESEAIG